MTAIEKKLNTFFVDTFNKILACEERAVQKTGLYDVSVKELHVIEAAGILEADGKSTMSAIAARLEVTLGALTTSVGALVKKGYLQRKGDEKDRRIVHIHLTDKGQEAYEKHEQFHVNMIKRITQVMDEHSLENLSESLNMLKEFFNTYGMERK